MESPSKTIEILEALLFVGISGLPIAFESMNYCQAPH
jgi:hypothetical protein